MAISIIALAPRLLDEGQRGSALLEMAFVIPFLLAIGLGAFEFGNVYYKYHLMENAVRDGARFAASRTGSICTDTALQAEAVNIVKTTGQKNNIWTTGYKITVSCPTDLAYDNKKNKYNYRGGDTIYTVRVKAEVPYQSLGFLGFFNLSPPTLTVSHDERVIGVR